MATRMLQRRGTAADWAAQNPVLSSGEIGIETDTGVMKTGNGVDAWSSLPSAYLSTSGGALSGNVTLNATPSEDDHLARKSDVDRSYVPIGGIIMFEGDVNTLPSGWYLCDGTNGTPDLTDRFIVGSEGTYVQGDTGGEDSVTLTSSEMPSHTHSGPSHSHSGPSHSHTVDPPNTTTTGESAHTHGAGSYTVLDVYKTVTDAQLGSIGERNRNTDRNVDFSVTGTSGAGSNHAHSVNIASFSSGNAGTGSTGSGGTGSTGSKGSDNAHENRPPYYALAFIQRVT